MTKEEIEVKFTCREVDAWMSTHNVDDMNAVLNGFISDLKTFCRSLVNLYEENKVPLAVLGVSVNVDASMDNAASRRVTLIKSQIGAPESLLDRMEKDMEGNGQDADII